MGNAAQPLAGGRPGPGNQGIAALNSSTGTFDPFNAFIRSSAAATRRRTASTGASSPTRTTYALIAKAQLTFDKAAQDRLLAELHTRAVDDALLIWVCHDVNPRAVSPKVAHVVQPQSWYIDLATVRMS